MGNTTKYWRGLEEAEGRAQVSAKGEFSDKLPMEEIFSDSPVSESSRRDFLKYFGFSVSAVALAACNKTPVKYAIPYIDKPENVTPGMPLYYATSTSAYNEGFPVLAKVREGRPIKLDGNMESFLSQGASDAITQASILSLYDINRVKSPLIEGVPEDDWSKVDNATIKALNKAQSKGIALLTRSNTGPMLSKAIAKFKETYSNVEHVSHDPISYEGILDANEKSFGKRVIPSYHFDKAEFIFSFGADFLGTWVSPVRFASDYNKMREVSVDAPTMSKHVQIESLMSLTGTNADDRYSFTPDKVHQYILSLHDLIAAKAGKATLGGNLELPGNRLADYADQLWNAKGKSIVVSGGNTEAEQLVVNAINDMLGNYGSTIDMSQGCLVSTMKDEDYHTFEKRLISGGYGAVVLVGTNPAYSSALGSEVKAALDKVTLISTATLLDESSADANILFPDNHALESWNILEPMEGYYLSVQPTISKVFNTRSAAGSLLTWSGEKLDFSEGEADIAKLYEEIITELGGSIDTFKHDGFYSGAIGADVTYTENGLQEAGSELASSSAEGVSLILYQKVGIRDGYNALNPWCHELPDPVSKVTYDNYITVSKLDADRNGWEQGDYVQVEANGSTIELPVLIQPGQSPNTLGIALGYGRKLSKQRENDLVDLGISAYPFTKSSKERKYILNNVTATKVDKDAYEFAQTQSHHTIEGRDYLREATLSEYKENPEIRNEHKHNLITLWEDHDYSKGHHWGMAIDLNKCNGCGSCIVSCHIENNVPVVGRDEIRRRREMHWLRIDRYYSFEVDESKDIKVKHGVFGVDAQVEQGEYTTEMKKVDGLEVAKKDEGKEATHYNNVRVTHLPVMCQHCDNAPCETVCPVLATTHSTEGLNQMTYNRCIGTKYCGNNCPYKVRRFNWFRYNLNDKFDYHFNNELGRMVLNPDVTVRSRGVMEKCSFCVQNIQSAKLTAKRENRKLKDGEAQVACAKACPSGAIVFGDMNDPNSAVSKAIKNERSYRMLEEVNTRPSVYYQTKIWNREVNQEETPA
jgi:MoCo/4Fe-4S cofactor protein with predicted Tat translocation signal